MIQNLEIFLMMNCIGIGCHHVELDESYNGRTSMILKNGYGYIKIQTERNDVLIYLS